MDLATIVILSSAIIIILQIVSIALIVKGKKPAPQPEPVAVPAPAGDNRDFRKRRDENQFTRRPAQDSRPRQPVTPEPQPVDHVEKSLRDINLRLKNAERDQENARKKIKDVAASPQNPQRRPDQNNTRPNRGRDDDFRRRDNNRDRNNNRPQGGQFRDRNRTPETDRPQMDQPVQSSLPPLSASAPVAPMPATVASVEILPRPQNAIAVPASIEKEQIPAVPENTEILHGRKVLVRRRILSGEEETAAGAKAVVTESQPVIGAVVQGTSEKSPTPLPDESVGNVPPIRFGR